MDDETKLGPVKDTRGRIVAVVAIKGGVGKSTIAANAVHRLSTLGYRVILVDCDEPSNRSSTKWVSGALPDVRIEHYRDQHALWDELPTLREQADYIIVDSPGSSDFIRQLLLLADLAVIPTGAGRLETDPLVEAVGLLRQAQQVRNGPPEGHVVLSKIGKGRKGNQRILTKQMRDLANNLQMPLAETIVWQSELHPQAATDFTFVGEMGRKGRHLAADFETLFYELFPETKPRMESIG